MAWSEVWDTIFQQNQWGKYPPEELIRFVARNYYRAPDRKQIRILEVGCGPGANIWYLAREGFSVYGIDGSSTAIDIAKNRLNSEELDARLQIGDILHLPYQDEFFDCVIDIECICANSVEDSQKILVDIRRVLKPGGKLFSKTFMTGSKTGMESHYKKNKESNESDKSEASLSTCLEEIRTISEDQISGIYACFTIECVDKLIRTENNQSYEVGEFLISCKK